MAKHILYLTFSIFIINFTNFYLSFQIFANDGTTHVGQIRKQWSGIVKEMFTDADNFGVTFPLDLDVKVKATLLGAIFLIVSICNLYSLEYKVYLLKLSIN